MFKTADSGRTGLQHGEGIRTGLHPRLRVVPLDLLYVDTIQMFKSWLRS